jgi:hypothetical protein
VISPAAADLLGVLAYSELCAFERNAADAAGAPSLVDKVELARLSRHEHDHFEQLCVYLSSQGIEPLSALEPFVVAWDTFHSNMAPRDWLEGLIKTYVGDGIAADFYREVSAYLDTDTAALINEVVSDSQRSEYMTSRLREAIAEDPKVAGRLALWGRRLMGEMISQATLVAGSRPALQEMFTEQADQVEGLINRLTVEHSRRMDALGLAS